jgi:predicted AlkP superfamily phosphohydrolase/phosphomutase
MDGVVGDVMAAVPAGTRLFVMSDHGFASWRRTFHLNSWLHQNGYLAVKDPNRLEAGIGNIDWSRTRAYGIGFNGLYINLRGREKSGSVDPAERDALVRELKEKLLAVVDPAIGQPAVTRMYEVGEQYMHGEGLAIGPDLVVGYAKGTRNSDDSALGGVTAELFSDNTREWSGDHSMDHEAVPGVLFSNAPLRQPVTRLEDLAPAIVAEFGITWQPAGREAGAAAGPGL